MEKNFLELIPLRNHEEYEETDGLIHLIFIHDKPMEKFLRWMSGKNRKSTLELDRLSSLAWKNFDGKNTVLDIINILLEAEKDSYESMEQRIILFTRLLLKKKLIVLKESQL